MSAAAPTVAESAVAYAYRQIGKPYIERGDGPNGFDCSGLVVAAYRHAGGFGLPHKASALRRVLRRVIMPLRLGDVVFYYDKVNPTHCAIYVGKTGKIGRRTHWVIQATNPKRDVEKIKMNQFTPAVAYGRVRRAKRRAIRR